jgi:hypothetical protein
MKKLRLGLCVSTVVLLSACAGGDVKEQAPVSNIPAWVLNPIIDDGLAATECVKWSGNMSIDKKQAVANARAGLVKQINIKVKAMDKTYARKTETQDKMVTSNVFESVSKQIAEQSLVGARPERVELVNIGDVQNLCAMVTLKPEKTQELLDSILAASEVTVSAQDKDILYEEFKSYKAHQELDAQ